MSHVTWMNKHVTRLNESCCMVLTRHGIHVEFGKGLSDVIVWNESCHTYEWVMSHIWTSHVTHMSESNHIHTRVLSHLWMSPVTHMNESCYTYEWDMSHIWMSQVTHIHQSCHTYEWVMSHIWMSHATHMNETCHTYEWDMSHTYMSLVTLVGESCHTYEWDMSHIVTSHLSSTNHIARTDESLHKYMMWQKSSEVFRTWSYRLSHVTHIHESCHTHTWVMSHTYMSDVTHMHESFRTHTWVMSPTHTSHDTRINKSRHTHKLSLNTRARLVQERPDLIVRNESCRIRTSVMSHTYKWVTSHVSMRNNIRVGFGKGLPDLINERRTRFQHFELMQVLHTRFAWSTDLLISFYILSLTTYSLPPHQWSTSDGMIFVDRIYYGVATNSRLLTIIGLFCKRTL